MLPMFGFQAAGFSMVQMEMRNGGWLNFNNGGSVLRSRSLCHKNCERESILLIALFDWQRELVGLRELHSYLRWQNTDNFCWRKL
jgi:hypothetical protein